MRVSFFCFVFALLVHSVGVSASPVDSVMQKLDSLSVGEQINYVKNLPFQYIISNNQRVIPVLLEFETLAAENDSVSALAKIYINLSLAYYYLGKYDENLRYGLKSIQLYDSIGDLQNLGTMYGELGYQMKRRDLARSFQLMRKGIEVLEDLGNIEPLAKIYDNYGVLHEINNQLDSATFFYKKALSYKKLMNDSLGIPYSYNNLFSVMMLRQNFDSAEYYLNQSTQIREIRNDRLGLAENFAYYGQLFSAKTNYQISNEFNHKALKIAKQHSYTYLVQQLYLDISRNYEKLGNFNNALEYFKLHKQYQDSLLNLETNKTIADLQVQYQTAEKEKELVLKNQQLKRERNIRMLVAGGSLLVIVFGILLFLLRMQFAKRNERIKVQNAFIEGEQNERNRLALELHDGVANDLNAAIIKLSNSDDDNFAKGVEMLRQTHHSVRKLSHNLMPRSLKENGLEKALIELLNGFGKPGLEINFQYIGISKRLPLFIEFNIYRIVQEAINNTIKHADAKNILVECNQIDKKLLVTIEDDGAGFDPARTSKGIGLQNINNRAKMIGGSFSLRTALGEGTVIEVAVPIV